MSKNLVDLEHRINYYFNDKNLLKNALIHRSFGNEHKHYKNINNEKLELLGDAVLGLVVAEYLYQKYPEEKEGVLAKIKSMAVSEPVLASISRKLRIGEYLLLSKGEMVTGGRDRNSILGDVFEAILGAIYLDSGFFAAKEYVLFHLKDMIDHIDDFEEILDFKTILQEYCQKKYRDIPKYTLVGEEGPDHRKLFEMQVQIQNNIAKAKGTNKKVAEQMAAKQLCKELGVKWL
ncbi:ribonuclease III [Fusobacterium gonidiaformans]|uniref:ribonuclease III n=1 Tax=Fusobacterium gonidiaformans TaxID=849 RepID=UPI0001BC6440|nr:ribonuclease III [Fusobacterium gonidiaformans]AVQ16592.1 ribonuclease III [Fusobacterium gonidiaformans ATCC 25563]EFS28164.2 ribonuclease III [Fusobacterium gonidiaformans ATCC 25563]